MKMKEKISIKKHTILFLHIPKTAGTSFLTVMKNVFGDEGVLRIVSPHSEFEKISVDLMKCDLSLVACIAGHIPRYIWHKYEDKLRYFVMLRDPIDRVFSLFRFLSSADAKDLAEIGLYPGFTFDEFLSTRAPGTFGQVNNGMSRMLSNKRSLNDPDDNAFWDAGSMLDELQENFAFLVENDFGIVEKMKETLRLVEKSWDIPYEIEEYRENSTSNDDGLRTVQNIHRIVELNTIDISLYQAARKLFHERVKALTSSDGHLTAQVVWQGTLGADTTISEISGRQGFYPSEDYNFSWLMFESTPKIHFFCPIELIEKQSWIDLRIYMITPSYKVESIVIKLNNVLSGFTITDIDENWRTLTVGPISFNSEIQQLTIELPYVIPVNVIEPNSMDQRHLGIALATVGFRSSFYETE